MTEPGPHDDSQDLLSIAPGVARVAAGAWLRTAEWALRGYLHAGERLLKAAVSGESAAQLVEESATEVRVYARRLLGLDAEESVDRPDHDVSLRARGEELLARSADVHYEEPAHPAYERILDELAPDEGRILRFLYLSGPQPAVDVRSSKTLNVTSQLVAPGLSMIGAQAGTRYSERVPAYLNNLYRLGLIWFSREPLEDPLRYQVLEAQPDVLTALKSGGRGRTVRRSIHLTPFGEDFCRVCLPVETAELEALGEV